MIGKISYMAIPATPKLKHGVDIFIYNSCKIAGITYAELMSKSRKAQVTKTRRIISYNLITKFMLTHEVASKMMNLDRSCMSYTLVTYINLYSQDFDFRELANKISEQ